MSEAHFRLIYDGEAVRDGEMDVADLAPALMGVGQLLKAAGRVMYGEESDVRVRVRTMKDGSFDVHLAAAVKTAGSLWDWLKTPNGQEAQTLLSTLGLTGLGGLQAAISIVRKLKGQKPRLKAARPGFVSIDIDGLAVEVPEAAARLAVDAGVGAALERVVAEPLRGEGFDTVSFGGAEPDATISKDEAVYFLAPLETEDDEFVSRYQKAFSTQLLSFKPDRKWRLSDEHGAAKLVTISDTDFETSVQRNGIRFAKGDILICEAIERSRRSIAGFKSEYEISKVLEHRPALPISTLDLPVD
jgi:hypothetical protein